MKNIKKLVALILVLVMTFSITACHPKDEIALSMGEHQITSAVYLTAVISADQDARNRAYEIASANGKTLTTDEDYYAQTIDGKNFVTYVKDTAIELCKQYIALDKLLADGKYKLSDEVKKEAEEMADYYWTSYGLGVLYEANGINFNTYKKTVLYSMMADEYFVSVYGEGGEKEVKEADIKKGLEDNFVLARVLAGSISSSMTSTQVSALKKEFEGYKTEIETGKKDFETIYIKYNNITDEQIKNAQKQEEGVEKPKDIFASVIGGSKTSNPDTNFAAIYSMKKDEIKLIESSSAYSVVICLDITEDPYYYNSLKEDVLHILKDEEHSEALKTYTAGLTINVNSYAIDRFDIKAIVTNSDLQSAY